MNDTDIKTILLDLWDEAGPIDEITSNTSAFLKTRGADHLPAVLLFTSETFAARRDEIENPDPDFKTIIQQQDAMLLGLRPYLLRHAIAINEIAAKHSIPIDELYEDWPELFAGAN